jgi:hypothetical protein
MGAISIDDTWGVRKLAGSECACTAKAFFLSLVESSRNFTRAAGDALRLCRRIRGLRELREPRERVSQ